jgi:hypothetical protein
MPEVEVHVVSCMRTKVQSPPKLAPNRFFHSLHVPKIGWMRTGCQVGLLLVLEAAATLRRPDSAPEPPLTLTPDQIPSIT